LINLITKAVLRIKAEIAVRHDLVFTGFNQLWKIISGPLTLVFIPLYLSPETQGYWFTFMSISALAVFADLGFTNIVLQFSAHEFAHLSFDRNFTAYGSAIHLKRLASFFKFTVRWCLMMSALAFPIILVAGIVIFTRKADQVLWTWPWVLYVAGSGINFFNNTLLSFFEGCNLVARVQRIRFEIAVINTVFVLSMLFFGAGLYALATAMCVSSLFIFVYIRRVFGKFIRQLLLEAEGFVYSWKKEFLRLFWKYALSWSSGYFIFQIYTPLMFYYHGAIHAGKIGITMALWSAAFSISNVWIYSVTPKINIHVSRKEWNLLDSLVKKRIILSMLTFIAGASFFIVAYLTAGGYVEILDRIFSRFMTIIPLLCLAFAWLIQLFVNGIAVYLRAHKQEPLVVPSLVSAAWISIATFISARFLPPDYIFVGFLSSYVWGVPWVLWIFRKKRAEWHA
jgi:hypothetical protein